MITLIIQFPGPNNRAPEMTDEERYMAFIKNESLAILKAADEFGVDVRHLLADVSYAVIVTDFLETYNEDGGEPV